MTKKDQKERLDLNKKAAIISLPCCDSEYPQIFLVNDSSEVAYDDSDSTTKKEKDLLINNLGQRQIQKKTQGKSFFYKEQNDTTKSKISPSRPFFHRSFGRTIDQQDIMRLSHIGKTENKAVVLVGPGELSRSQSTKNSACPNLPISILLFIGAALGKLFITKYFQFIQIAFRVGTFFCKSLVKKILHFKT